MGMLNSVTVRHDSCICVTKPKLYLKRSFFGFLKIQSKCFERNTKYTSFKPVITCYCLFRVSVNPEKNCFHSVKGVIHCH